MHDNSSGTNICTYVHEPASGLTLDLRNHLSLQCVTSAITTRPYTTCTLEKSNFASYGDRILDTL